MRRKSLFGVFTAVAIVALWAACGGSSSSSSAGGTSGTDGADTTAGEASLESLAAIPTIDLEEYDSSTSTSANLSALVPKSVGVGKGIGESMNAVGGSSRAGCEANMHKQEIFRMSQMIQLERCYPEAMETAGFITIPSDGSYALYKVAPPEMEAGEQTGMCDDISAEREDEKADCLERSQGGPMIIWMRIGRIGSELHVDMCEGASPVLMSEATYGASGSIYTATATRIGQWGGGLESSSFGVTADLGSTGTVTDGIVTFGDDGSLVATGQMDGNFGSGNIRFERVASDSSNIVSGGFAGEFTDPFSNTATRFTGKAYSRFGGSTATGCARFSFSGTMPAMRVSDMIPFDIPAGQEEEFLTAFAAELGISAGLTIDSKLCPNPDFDPENAATTATIKPMVLLEGESCGEVAHTGVECFGITNGTVTTDFGTEIRQSFIIVASTASPFFAEVNAYDVSALSPTIGTIAFPRSWDCSGSFTTLDFMSFTPAQMAAAEAGMQKCFAIEEKARGKEGMGGYNCGQQQQMNDVNDFAEEGGGASTFGVYGGGHHRAVAPANIGTCPTVGLPESLFVNVINSDNNEYCLGLMGTCEDFTIVNNAANNLTIDVNGNGVVILTTLLFARVGDAAPTGVTATYTGLIPSPCTAIHMFDQPTFNAPTGGFGTEGGAPPPGGAPGDAHFIPQACIDAGFTTEEDKEACGQLCMETRNCRD